MLGVVVIGRNEGERLKRCLNALKGTGHSVVYVDSGSIDSSTHFARAQGVEVVDLNLTIPFSAARARNEGFSHLITISPNINYVQFIDGDCEIMPGWIDSAVAAFEKYPDVAIVTGRLNERYPEVSIYNRLGDFEWNSANAGLVTAVGGIFMMRCGVFVDVGGFDTSIVAGEEPELCLRVAQQGWRILRLDSDMAWHDLGMVKFSQWWRRQVRGGYGGLDVAIRFGIAHYRRNNWRARFWSAWPIVLVLGGSSAGLMIDYKLGILIGIIIFFIWPLQMARISAKAWRKGHPISVAVAYGFFTMLSFWPQMLGQIKYLVDRARGHSPRLIEYKQAIQAPDDAVQQ